MTAAAAPCTPTAPLRCRRGWRHPGPPRAWAGPLATARPLRVSGSWCACAGRLRGGGSASSASCGGRGRRWWGSRGGGRTAARARRRTACTTSWRGTSGDRRPAVSRCRAPRLAGPGGAASCTDRPAGSVPAVVGGAAGTGAGGGRGGGRGGGAQHGGGGGGGRGAGPGRRPRAAGPRRGGAVGAALSTAVVAGLAAGCAAVAARAWRARQAAARDEIRLRLLIAALGAMAADLRAGRSLEAAAASAARGCGDDGLAGALLQAL